MESHDQHVADFVVAWKEEFGEETSEATARIRRQELVELYLLVEKAVPGEKRGE